MLGNEARTYESSHRDYGVGEQVNRHLKQYFDFSKSKARDMQTTHFNMEEEAAATIDSNYRQQYKPDIFINCVPPKNDFYRKNRQTMELGDRSQPVPKSESQEK